MSSGSFLNTAKVSVYVQGVAVGVPVDVEVEGLPVAADAHGVQGIRLGLCWQVEWQRDLIARVDRVVNLTRRD